MSDPTSAVSGIALFNDANYVAAKKLLDAAELMHEAHASNIANVETPGYKRVDIDPNFESQLKAAYQSGDTSAIDNVQINIIDDKTTAAVRPDGNNVSMETELMMDNKTAVNYDSLEQYLSTSLQQLQQAVKTN
jgi:flagellar basal-body rod protein FlgB